MLNVNRSGSSGKAGTLQQSDFFQQIVGGPNPLNPREMVVQAVPGSGIPIRDYFAARALAVLSGYDDDAHNFEAMARDAYRLADAMLKARQDDEPYPQNLDEFQDAK